MTEACSWKSYSLARVPSRSDVVCGPSCNRLIDQLSLTPARYLKEVQDDLVEACSGAASLLAHLKQLVEIRGEDNKQK